MAEPVAPPPTIPRRVVVAGFLALTLIGLALTSLAFFNSRTRANGFSVATGVVNIAAAPTTVALTGLDLAPGDVVAAPLELTNDGSLELRYAITSTTTEDILAQTLQLTVLVDVTDCTAAGVDLDGSVVAGPVPLGSTTGEPVLGDPARGAQPGDRVLAPASGERLCLRVELPAATDLDTVADRSTTTTLRIDAEQTVANP